MPNILHNSAPPVAGPQPDPWETVKEVFKVGSVVPGTVLRLTDYGAFVQLASGILGLLHISDMSQDWTGHPSELVSVGQKLDVMILRIKKSKRKIGLGLKQLNSIWTTVETKYAVGQKIRGEVIRRKMSGLKVELEPDLIGLVPVAEISWASLKSCPIDAFAPGQEVEALVLEIDCLKRRMTLSIRQLKPDPWGEVEAKYPVGTRVKGTVCKLVPYGAFVEIEQGICGMVHISNMTWSRKISRPSELLKEGGEVEAVVLNVDKPKRHLALGIKQLSQDPWESIDQLYKVGDPVKGKIYKLTTFGAFIELQHGFQGMVHISQISGQPVAKVKDVLEVGQVVSARIIKIDHDERRIGLSMLASRDD
jgi:small subunit ribosomal protein S1